MVLYVGNVSVQYINRWWHWWGKSMGLCRKTLLQCGSNGVTSFLHQPVEILWTNSNAVLFVRIPKFFLVNKTNLRDLIAATGLVILLRLDSNRRFFARVTLKFDGWPWKTIGHLSFAVPSFVQHFIAIGEFKLELQSGNAQFGSNSTIFF